MGALRVYDLAYERHMLDRASSMLASVSVDCLDSTRVATDVAAVAAEYEPAVSADPVRSSFCGGVSVRVQGNPVSVSICHCSVCQRLSGAPSVTSALFSPQRVEVTSDCVLVETRTSPSVVRRRCSVCFSPVVGSLGTKYVAVPVALFDWGGGRLPAAWCPTHHLHYASRLLDVQDPLVKYRHRHRGPR